MLQILFKLFLHVCLRPLSLTSACLSPASVLKSVLNIHQTSGTFTTCIHLGSCQKLWYNVYIDLREQDDAIQSATNQSTTRVIHIFPEPNEKQAQ